MSIDNKSIRVRFAPSPTGPLHIGGVRTALYNFLFARKNGGKFILRIEDTDKKRFVSGAEKYIIESLNWCGLTPDEGPEIGGEYGPYRQSERKSMYYSYVQQLIDSDCAYYAFDTPEELDKMRENMKASGIPSPTYNSISRSSMKNSLTLPKEEVVARIEAGEKYVIRIKMLRNQEIKFEDEIRGWVSVNSNNIDDKVIFKSDGMPTYHLANVVDDYLMKISHVIRGEEWLPSAPLHVYLYSCFGWDSQMPTYAHLPLILKPDGNGKLSKRDGDRLGFPVFPLDWISDNNEDVFTGYREKGFSSEAFINMLAFLGWNPGTEQEVFNLSQLISEFSLDRVGKSGSKYDYSKTKWFNQQHLRLKSNQEILDSIINIENDLLQEFSKEYILKVIALVKERAVFESDILSEGQAFFSDNIKMDEFIVNKKWNTELVPNLIELTSRLYEIPDFTHDNIENIFKSYLLTSGLKLGKIMPMLRLSITGNLAGPSMFHSLELLGRDKMKSRIYNAIENLK
ncbi:MAG: glutamate--tRNA ligase [Flavobacteriales bacterium]|jgi:glutamyl-tRNA synthetase|nr:glutamate--tRNA ligase [Flavobacteriales bacterium]|tara:strand:- start:1214 stop:2749 length:1536 start_codon:yes stop_codon:yes gene_type:complete